MSLEGEMKHIDKVKYGDRVYCLIRTIKESRIFICLLCYTHRFIFFRFDYNSSLLASLTSLLFSWVVHRFTGFSGTDRRSLSARHFYTHTPFIQIQSPLEEPQSSVSTRIASHESHKTGSADWSTSVLLQHVDTPLAGLEPSQSHLSTLINHLFSYVTLTR